MPGQSGQRFFQLAQAALGRADQVADGRGAGSHFRQHGFGRDAAVHQPGALGFPILLFDLGQHGAQGLVVDGIADEHFVAERQALRRDDECDDDRGGGRDKGGYRVGEPLQAVGALVAAVAEAAQAI